MKKILFTFLCLQFLIVLSHAQTNTLDTISITKKMLGADFDFKGKNISLTKLEDLYKPYQDANDEMFMVKRNNNPALLLTLLGAALIGYSAYKFLMGDNQQWYFAGGGALMIGGTIPLYIGARNHSINAARIYNYEIRHLPKAKP